MDIFCKTITAVASVDTKFKDIFDGRQRKFSQAEIQNKQSRKVSLRPRWLSRFLHIPQVVFKSKHERILREGGYI